MAFSEASGLSYLTFSDIAEAPRCESSREKWLGKPKQGKTLEETEGNAEVSGSQTVACCVVFASECVFAFLSCL